MKFTIKRTVLLDALAKVSRAVSLKSPLPVLTGIKFDLDNEGLLLTGSDSDIVIQTKITDNLTIEEPGAVVLSSRYILDIVRKIDSETISFQILDGALTRIEGASSQFNLNGISSVDYPRVAVDRSGTHLQMDAMKLKELIDKTSFATSEAETRPVLTGVNFKYTNQVLTCVATDSYRLAQMSAPMADDLSFNIIIPKKSLVEISRIVDKDGVIDLYVSSRRVVFTIGGYTIVTRLIDGKFPDTSHLIEASYPYELSVGTAALLGAIDRATLLSDSATKNIVKLTMSSDEVVLTGSSQEIGSAEEVLPEAFFKGEGSLTISFSGRYLADAVRSINGETVRLFFTGGMRPFVVKDYEKDDNIQIVLPIRN